MHGTQSAWCKYEFDFEYMIRTSKIRTSFNIPNKMVIKYPATVTTCNTLFTKNDFLQKCTGNIPDSKILHLKFQKKIPEVITLGPFCGMATPSLTHPQAQPMPPIMPDAQT